MMITTEYTAASTRRALVPARGPSAWPELDASVVGTSLSRSDLAHQACAVKTATGLRRFGEGIQNRRGGRMLGIFFLRTVYIFFLFYTVTFAMKLGNEKPACSDARRARAISALQTRCWEPWFYGVEWSCPASPALSRPVACLPRLLDGDGLRGKLAGAWPSGSLSGGPWSSLVPGGLVPLIFPLLMSPAASLRATPLLSLPLLASVGTFPHLPDATLGIFHRPDPPHPHP